MAVMPWSFDSHINLKCAVAIASTIFQEASWKLKLLWALSQLSWIVSLPYPFAPFVRWQTLADDNSCVANDIASGEAEEEELKIESVSGSNSVMGSFQYCGFVVK